MKTIIQAMLEEIYSKAWKIATEQPQVVGEKKDFYITLEQLDTILQSFQD